MGNLTRLGIDQYDLVTLLRLIKTNFNALLAKLDADGGVADTNYAALWALTLPGANIEATGTGIGNADVIDFLAQAYTNYNGVIAKLNADGGVTDTNYAVLTSLVGEKLAIFAGINQTDLITALQTFITGIATLTAKLDADGGVTDTNYAATCNVADTVDDSGQ